MSNQTYTFEDFHHMSTSRIILTIGNLSGYESGLLLHAAASRNSIELLHKAMSNKFTNINDVFADNTALTLACKKNNIEFVEELLKYDNLDVNKRPNNVGFTAFQIVTRNKFVAIAQMLKFYQDHVLHTEIPVCKMLAPHVITNFDYLFECDDELTKSYHNY